MHGESEYNIMFGPDICGYSTKRVHVIFNYKGENHLIKKDVKCKDDEGTHIYTLIVSPDNTYKVNHRNPTYFILLFRLEMLLFILGFNW